MRLGDVKLAVVSCRRRSRRPVESPLLLSFSPLSFFLSCQGAPPVAEPFFTFQGVSNPSIYVSDHIDV